MDSNDQERERGSHLANATRWNGTGVRINTVDTPLALPISGGEVEAFSRWGMGGCCWWTRLKVMPENKNSCSPGAEAGPQTDCGDSTRATLRRPAKKRWNPSLTVSWREAQDDQTKFSLPYASGRKRLGNSGN